ncbi:tRNA (adenosine(37)-N6)-threonylcarbamoyltransferase complex dimerization subunit type 1 TsaB [Sulfurirhabdus autotrophica]|uniref:tRNA (adenosine(37)-N6)-threonylcarbamoyltransferase complex dimerization subunit type 1 TsaB n=1 Tax=Sulfurirhabdus autotrophica TaxID=1706046 RepID=UPI000F613836|nr:tRNA (adenosine(37)-N6)-threonylcarbamoyltransferase complex dimerization subunit type 1 TsaB [Sulfurirhabdus autotrophica]
MKILALDTSTEYCSLALSLGNEVLTREVLAGQRHSELILPMLQEMLDEADITLNELDGVAFGSGPGSFTGLRIGCGVAQGLAFGADLPVAGICTLEALAEGSNESKVISCLDARMGEIYHAIYEKSDGQWNILSEPGLYSPQNAPHIDGDEWIGCGSGFSAYGEALKLQYGSQLKAVFGDVFPHARHIASLAIPVFQQGRAVEASKAAPLYIRDKVALKTSER